MPDHPIIFGFASIVSLLALSGCGEASARPPATPAGALATTALTESADALAGSWRCSGSVYGPEGASPSEVTLDVRLDLDAAWLRTTFAVSSGKYPYGFNAYRTFDSSQSKWVNVIVDNIGGHTVSWSSDGVVWTGEARGPMGKMEIRDTETLVRPDELRMLGEYSLDTRSWNTGYELTCSK